jgi:tetratricopeptide (TPR) repeat protein
MIVKNEQPFLDGCLESLRGLVDEVVIVDTGSTDDSVEIARIHGARVLNHEWRDDFAAARNYSLDAAASEWILYIDADERLVDTTRESLRAGLDAADVYAARPLFRVNSNSTFYREFRLFRNDPRLRFKGAMHETILPDLAVLQRKEDARVVDSSAKLIHLGYDGDMTAKYSRNLPLLRISLGRDPDRIYYWKDLADTLAGLGKIEEAIAAAEEGLVRTRAASGQVSQIRHSSLIYTQARLLVQRGEDVLELIETGLALHPRNWSLLFLRARARINVGALEAAIGDLRLLLAQVPETIIDDVAHDRRIFGAYAHDLMGVALLRQGDRAGAAAAFARAAEAAPEVQEYRVKALALGAGAATGGSSAA